MRVNATSLKLTISQLFTEIDESTTYLISIPWIFNPLPFSSLDEAIEKLNLMELPLGHTGITLMAVVNFRNIKIGTLYGNSIFNYAR